MKYIGLSAMIPPPLTHWTSVEKSCAASSADPSRSRGSTVALECAGTVTPCSTVEPSPFM